MLMIFGNVIQQLVNVSML